MAPAESIWTERQGNSEKCQPVTKALRAACRALPVHVHARAGAGSLASGALLQTLVTKQRCALDFNRSFCCWGIPHSLDLKSTLLICEQAEIR